MQVHYLRDELNNQQMARKYIFLHLFSNRTASEFKLLSFGGLKRCLTLTHHITRLVRTQHKLDKISPKQSRLGFPQSPPVWSE